MRYSAQVWEHFVHPRYVGAWPAAAFGIVSARADTPACDAVLQLQWRVADERIEEARFLAYGGVCVIAVGSWLAEYVSGTDLARANSSINAAAIAEALNLGRVQRYAAVLAEDAFRACFNACERIPLNPLS